MGCTPKGMSIPESDQFRFNSYIPKLTFMGPPIKVEDPLMNIVTPSYKSGEWDTSDSSLNSSMALSYVLFLSPVSRIYLLQMDKCRKYESQKNP